MLTNPIYATLDPQECTVANETGEIRCLALIGRIKIFGIPQFADKKPRNFDVFEKLTMFGVLIGRWVNFDINFEGDEFFNFFGLMPSLSACTKFA